MRERNHSYPSPGSAESALESEFREGKLTLEELRLKEVDVALADASCYVNAGLIEARFEIEREVVASKADSVRAYRASWEEALQQSERLVRR